MRLDCRDSRTALTVLTAEQISRIAREYDIDLEKLVGEEQEAIDRYKVAYCPRGECYLATLFVDGGNLVIIPFCHSPPIHYCPFCPHQPLRTWCANKDCQSGIREHCYNCPDCGKPYVETPVDYKIPDPVQLASFVAQVMAMRREIVEAFLAQHPIKSGKNV